MAEKSYKDIAVNRKARHEYFVEEHMECGIELKGTEVKSIKTSQFSFVDSYAKVENEELWLVGLHITPYLFGNRFNHEPVRDRRLLAHKKEIKRLKRKIMERGLTLIPLKFYLKQGLVKVELGICKGKKLYDKREDIKQRDIRRDTEKDFKVK